MAKAARHYIDTEFAKNEKEEKSIDDSEYAMNLFRELNNKRNRKKTEVLDYKEQPKVEKKAAKDKKEPEMDSQGNEIMYDSNGEEIYYVEKVVGHRIENPDAKNKEIELEIKWIGYTECTWEPFEQFA